MHWTHLSSRVARNILLSACRRAILQPFYKLCILIGGPCFFLIPRRRSRPMSNCLPLLEMRGVVKSFPGVRALRGVNLRLQDGEVLALLGENGAGKSTLIKILGGALRAEKGSMAIDGREASFHSPQESRRGGVAVI